MILANNTRFCRRVIAAIAATVGFTALTAVGLVPAWAAGEAIKSKTADAAPDQSAASHKGKSDVGIRGHGFVADNGVFTPIDVPGAARTQPFGINNYGQIVGAFDEGKAGNFSGFLRDKRGRFISIDVPGAAGTGTVSINECGQMVGVYSETIPDTQVTNDTRSFLFDRGEFTWIDFPGAVTTRAHDIDNHGRIVGEYQDNAGATHGFLRDSSGTFTTIDIPSAPVTGLSGINDRGQMIGAYGDANGATHAFLLDNGVVTIIDVPNATL